MVRHFTTSIMKGGDGGSCPGGNMKVENMLQISMDGPNVNLSFYDKISDKLKTDHECRLVNIGSCGLHTVHNCFKSGAEASKWDISSFLKGVYTIFSKTSQQDKKILKLPPAKPSATDQWGLNLLTIAGWKMSQWPREP